MWLRIFTLDEARALLPQVRRVAEAAQEAFGAWQDAAAHRDDLRIVHGDDVADPASEVHEEYVLRSAECDRLAARVQEQARQLAEMGVQLKDPSIGLVDFHALHGDRLVYLCWRLGEEDIVAWHSLTGGFQGRQPLPDLTESGARR